MSDLAYLNALGEARCCLAALADAATTDDEASYFERLLIHLDLVTDDVGPTTWPIQGDRDELLARLAVAATRVLVRGIARGP